MAKNSEYMSVQEVAEIVHKSPQWIYKLINRKATLSGYARTIGGSKKIHKSAIWEVFGVEYEGHKPGEEKKRDSGDDWFTKQLEKKDAQIEAMQRTIDSLTESLRNEQLLHANANRRIELLEARQHPVQEWEDPDAAVGKDPKQESETPMRKPEEPAAPVEHEDPPKKKTGLFGRICKWLVMG